MEVEIRKADTERDAVELDQYFTQWDAMDWVSTATSSHRTRLAHTAMRATLDPCRLRNERVTLFTEEALFRAT